MYWSLPIVNKLNNIVLNDSVSEALLQLEEDIVHIPEAIQMQHNLLKIKKESEARIHSSDSLILSIVKYYEAKNDSIYLTEAYYYAGRVYYEQNNVSQSLYYLQKAEETTNDKTDCQLKSMIHSLTGNIHINLHDYDSALKQLIKARDNSLLANDSTGLILHLRDMGRTFIKLNQADSAFHYYKKSYQTAQLTDNTYLSHSICRELSNSIMQLKDCNKMRMFLTSIFQQSANTDPAPYYTASAYYFEQTGQNDSARYYYTHILHTIGNYYLKQNACQRLAHMAHQKGNEALALKYMNNYSMYTDSLRQLNEREDMLQVHNLHNSLMQEKENFHLRRTTWQHQWIIEVISLAIVFTFLLFILILVALRAIKKKRKIQRQWQEAKLQAINDEKYRYSPEYIRQNEKRIAELTQQLQDKEQQKDELSMRLQEMDRELLELANRQAETRLQRNMLSEQAFKESTIHQRFYDAANPSHNEDEKITSEDWQELSSEIDQAYNNFTQRLRNLYPAISEQEMHLALLGKIGISPSGMARITVHSKQAITSARKALYEKVHKKLGTPKEWDEFIRDF